MISRCFTLAAHIRVYQLVVVLSCCCNVGRGDTVSPSFCLPILPVSETTETEQAPSETAPEEREASWAVPRGRDVRQLGLSFGQVSQALQERAGLWRPAPRSGALVAQSGFEHAQRSGLGAPLRI
jgi:hypothetical protein